MSERRPHWTDDLIVTTVKVIEDSETSIEAACAVIAAVEEWQATQVRELEANFCNYSSYEAAIQRVRDALVDREKQLKDDPKATSRIPLISMQRIKDCLDGAP